MKIKSLKANNGDCFLVSFKDNSKTNRNILIDGGMAGSYYDPSTNSFGDLKIEIDYIRNNGEIVDLLILTHIDNDHILGLLKWFEMDKKAHELIGNVWFNSGKLIAEYLKEPENSDLTLGLKIFKSPETGVNEALAFEDYLIQSKIWNRKVVMKGARLTDFGINIKVLSPDDAQLKKLLKEYKDKTGDAAYTGGKEKDWSTDLSSFIAEELSNDFRFKQDGSVKNGSSISIILSIHGKKFLFLGDSHPKGIVDSLKELGYTKKTPLEVELFKLSHHGSKGNTNKDLLELVKTNNYLISTDSSGHGHPNKTTLARIININPSAVLHFNYEYVKENLFTKNDFVDFKEFKIKTTNEFNFEL